MKDRALAEGLALYEASLGPHGYPRHWGEGAEATNFEARTRHDDLQELVERWGDEKHEPGDYVTLVDTRVKDDG